MYEGEYLNGKRNGKGKEYYKNGKLIFEGEYLNGKKWEGKGYNFLNNDIYDIYEIKKGRGWLKEYDNVKLRIYEGGYLNGLRNGKGKEYDSGKLIFEGEYLYGERIK